MQALLIGDHENREFIDVCRWLGEQTDLHLAADVQQAREHLAAAPHLVVLAQARPGKFTKVDLERIYAQAPLARLVALLGSWCEGETRSGRPWPGVRRLYWHEALPRLAVLLSRTAAGDRAIWNLPRTATDAEWLLAATKVSWSGHCAPGAPMALGGRRGVAAISARRFATFAALAEACQVAGLAAVWLSPERPASVQGASLALWDSAGWGPYEAQELVKLTAFIAPAPVIALVDFPRLAERDQVLAAGAKAVVSKPFLLDDLFWQFDQVLARKDRQTTLGEAA